MLFVHVQILLGFRTCCVTSVNEIANELDISTEKEILLHNIEASLERIDGKRRAMENLLIRVLTSDKEFAEAEVHELFPREIIDSIVVLSGGHPRRFLEICSKVLEKSEGIQDEHLFNKIMLSSAEVRNSARNELSVQLGMKGGSESQQYQEWYVKTIRKVVDQSITKPRSQKKSNRKAMRKTVNDGVTINNPIIAIPRNDMRNNFELAQWIRDAIAIGDFLEIVYNYAIENKFYYLLAVNPATVYDFYGENFNFLEYQTIVEIQRGARRLNNDATSSLATA